MEIKLFTIGFTQKSAREFFTLLKEAGVPVRLDVKRGAGHGWLTILDDVPTMADWFDQHLLGKKK